MAEPTPNLTDDESVDGLTDSDVGDAEATTDHGTGEQQHVSDRSEEEGSDSSDDDGEEEDGDREGGEVMEDAFAAQAFAQGFAQAFALQDSDTVREEGNALFKEKKVRRFSLIRFAPTKLTIFSVQGSS